MIRRIYRALRRRIFPSVRNEEEKRIECSWMGFSLKSNGRNYQLSSEKFPLITIRKDSTDLLVVKQIFEQREYDFFVDKILDSKMPVNTILDLGANVGIASLYFAHHFPNAYIVALEPDPDNFSLLKKNVTGSNVLPIHAAVWSQNELLEIDYGFSKGGEWERAVRPIEKGKHQVNGYSFQTIFEKYGLKEIDVVKMDIEGSEEVIFKEECNLDFLYKTRFINVEIHFPAISTERIKSILTKYGFDVFEREPNLIGVRA